MQIDITELLWGNAIVTVVFLPLCIGIATVVRTALLFSGRKRSFSTWTRNRILAIFSILTAPGMAITVLIRYLVGHALQFDIESFRVDTTFSEVNFFLVLKRPPRVFFAALGLFLSMFFSVYLGLLLLLVSFAFSFLLPLKLLCGYLTVSILLNSTIRGGDLDMFWTSLREQPQTGLVELAVFFVLIATLYAYVMGVLPL